MSVEGRFGLFLAFFRRLVYFALIAEIAGCSRSVIIRDISTDGYSWPMFGKTPAHINYTSESFDPPLVLSWKRGIAAAPVLSTVFSGNTVFAASKAGQLQAFHHLTGEKIGTIKHRAGQSASPLIAENSLILSLESGGSTLYSYDLNSGRESWNKKLGNIHASPVYLDNRIYISTLKGTVYSVFLNSGEIDWQWKTKELLLSSPAAYDTFLVVAGLNGMLAVLNNRTSDVLWESSGERTFRTSPVISDGNIFIGDIEGNVSCFSLGGGTERWKFNAGNKIYSTPACDDKRIIFGCNDGRIYSLQKEDGKLLWSFPTNGLVVSSPLIAGRTVYCGSLDNTLYALDINSGEKIWDYKVDGQVTQSPLFTGSRIIVCTNKKMIFAFSKEE